VVPRSGVWPVNTNARKASDEHCGVASADGTTIDHDAYGSGPAVILIGAASQHQAIDPRTAEIANDWGGGLHGSRL
jgi:hypothetical protein